MTCPELEAIDLVAGAASVDESKLAEAIIAVGSDALGLRRLTEKYGPAADWRILGYIALAFSRVAWQRTTGREQLSTVLFDFMATVRTRYHPGTLISTLNALHGLSATDAIGAPDPLPRHLGGFLLTCLNHPDATVRTNAVDVMCHLWTDRSLMRLLPYDDAVMLRRRIAGMAANQSDDLIEADLRCLEGFWRTAQ